MNKVEESVRALVTDPVFQQRLAKFLVHECFRNSKLENLYTSVIPKPKTGDDSDYMIKTIFGTEVPWPRMLRFDDAQMIPLTTDVVNRTYLCIHSLFDEETGCELLLRLRAGDLVPEWENPTLPAKDAHGA